jgi:glycosyltransferase involved in cell wall biosynthesis
MAAALVYPSLYEGFGLPILEAMACGTPVITSNRGAMQEVAGAAALLVDPVDIEQIAAASARVLSDRDLAESLRQQGLARAAEFSWARAARQTVALYEAVLGRAGRDRFAAAAEVTR